MTDNKNICLSSIDEVRSEIYVYNITYNDQPLDDPQNYDLNYSDLSPSEKQIVDNFRNLLLSKI